MKTEKTSKAVAKVAGKVLRGLKNYTDNRGECSCCIHSACLQLGITVEELRALAGSALTQAEDKTK